MLQICLEGRGGRKKSGGNLQDAHLTDVIIQPVDHHNEWIIDDMLLAHQPPTDETKRVDPPA